MINGQQGQFLLNDRNCLTPIVDFLLDGIAVSPVGFSVTRPFLGSTLPTRGTAAAKTRSAAATRSRREMSICFMSGDM